MAIMYVAVNGDDANSGAVAGSPKTLVGGIAAAASGDTISMADGEYPWFAGFSNKTLHFVSRTPAPLATGVPGFTEGHPARRNRTVTIITATPAGQNAIGITFTNCTGSTFTHIRWKFNSWCDTTLGETLHTKYNRPNGNSQYECMIVNSSDVVFNSCEFMWGYGPNQDPYDTSAYYPEYQSGAFATSGYNVTGHGDPYQSWWVRDDTITGTNTPGNTAIPNGRAYNTMVAGPYFVRNDPAYKPATYLQCHFHDVRSALLYTAKIGKLTVDQCWFERVYIDYITGGTGTGSVSGLSADAGVTITRSIFETPFSQGSDSGNPHSDILQHYSSLTADYTNPAKVNIRFERNFTLIRPNDRGFFQLLFLQGAASHKFDLYDTRYTNPLIRNNTSLQSSSNKGAIFSYVSEGDISNNMFLSNPGLTSATATSIDAATNPQSLFNGKTRVQSNIAEIVPGKSNYGGFTNNFGIGTNYSKVSQSSFYVNSAYPASSAPTSDWYAHTVPGNRKAPYNASGPQYASLNSLVLDPITTEDITPFVGFDDAILCNFSTMQTSEKSIIRGPLGATLAVSVTSGEFRIENSLGVVMNDWGAAALPAVPVGSYIRLRHTSAAASSTQVTQTVSLKYGSNPAYSYTFNSSTDTSVLFPSVDLNNTSFNTVGSAGVESTSVYEGTLAVRFTPTVAPTATAYLVGGSNAGGFNIMILSTSKIRLQMRNGVGALVITGLDSNQPIIPGNEYLLIMTVNTNSEDPDKIFQVKGWNLTDKVSHLTWGNPTTAIAGADIGYTRTNARSFGSVITGSSQPKFAFLFRDSGPGKVLDPLASSTLNLFTPLNIGSKGEGVFGNIPKDFVVGSASEYNVANGINLGTGAKLVKTGNGAIDLATAPWPPAAAAIKYNLGIPAGPYTIGQSIPLSLVLSDAAGVAYNVSLTSDKEGTFAPPSILVSGGSASVITFTPTATGSHTIGIASSSPYALATPGSITVNPVPVGGNPTVLAVTKNLAKAARNMNVRVVFTLDTPATVPVVVTPVVSGVTGVFTPTTVTIAIGDSSGTAMFRSTSLGTPVLSATNDSALSNVPAEAIQVVENVKSQLVGLGIK